MHTGPHMWGEKLSYFSEQEYVHTYNFLKIVKPHTINAQLFAS